MPKSPSNPQTPPWLPHTRAPSWQLPSPSCLGPHGLALDGRHLCTLLLALILLLLLLFLSRCFSPAVPMKPVCYVFPVASLAKKWKGMMEKKKKKQLSENERERERESEWESERERDWVSVSGMVFAVCSVFTARGFIRLSAGPRARLNGHRCPVWAWNLLLAPLAPLACLHPLLLAVLRCRCQ